MSAGITGDFALDVNSVSKLKYSAKNSPDEGLRQAAQQFEALFLQQMLKRMRSAMPQSELMQSQQSKTYQSMMDQQWAQTLAERGVGIADMLTAQLRGNKPEGGAETGAAQGIDAIPRAQPKPLAASRAIAPGERFGEDGRPTTADKPAAAEVPLMAAAESDSPLVDIQDNPAAVVSGAEASASARVRDAVLPAHVSRFLDRMGDAAGRAAEQSGVPKRLILAQAALETGWGKHETRHADGRPTHNVFNIKATGWSGESTRVNTTEYVDRQAYSTRDAFRSYGSYDQAFSDYARLIGETPRYRPVVEAPDAKAAAHALQRCGYATDPRYAEKLVSIMNQLPADRAPAADESGRPLIDMIEGARAADRVDARANGGLL